MNVNSAHFNDAWFVEVTRRLDEGARIDFKREYYKFGTEDAEFKFARHLIALANVAWRISQPCWIVFGVDDKTRAIVGLGDDYPDVDRPDWWNDSDVSIHTRMNDGVEKRFRDCAGKWIEPDVPSFRLEYGSVEGDKFVSYLVIEPSLSSRPFCLKRSHAKHKSFPVGTVFIRKGSSSVPLAPSEVPVLLQACRAEYLNQLQWKQLIEKHTLGRFEDARSLYPLFQPKVESQDLLALDVLIQDLDSRKRLVLISGPAGQGKTVLMHQVAYELARRHNLDLVTRRTYFAQDDPAVDEDRPILSIADELEVVPSHPVPVFMALRIAFNTQIEFEKRLLVHIERLSGKSSFHSLESLFRIPGSWWVLLLDGIDEIRNRWDSAAILRTWAESLPDNVQLVVASRPYAVTDVTGARISLAPLSAEEALRLMKSKLQQVEVELNSDLGWNSIETWLRENSDLFPLIARQRALDGLVQFLTGVPAPSFTTEIDRDQVRLVERQHIEQYIEGHGAIPVIAQNVTAHIGLVESTETSSEEAERESWTPPALALAVQAITEYMCHEEMKRQQDWGDDKQRARDRAEHDLGQVAWHTDWHSDSFDPRECEQCGWLHPDTLIWNEDIGFVEREQSRRYRFLCSLLRRYLAANYALYESDEDTIVDRILLHDLDLHATQVVLTLLNELRAANGKTTL